MEEEKQEERKEKEAERTVEKKGESKEKERKEEKKKVEVKKKDEAVVRGKDLRISTKHSIAICKFIRGKRIEEAVFGLEEVLRKEKAIPMKGEIPHRKGIGRGRYPVKACEVFIKLLRSLLANSVVNALENPYISTAKADIAYRPHKRFGSGRSKRSHVLLIAKEWKEGLEEKKGKERKKDEGKEKKKKIEGKTETMEVKKAKEEKKEEKQEEWKDVDFGIDVFSAQQQEKQEEARV